MDMHNDEIPTAARKRVGHPGKIKDETGNRYGRLLVLRIEGRNICQQVTWRCLCDCGEETVQAGATLRAGTVVSCGCYGVEARRAATQTHGLSNTPIHSHYRGMMSRMAEGHPKAKNYYGRGLRVCDRWLQSFQNFVDDMLPKLEEAKRLTPDEDLTLERRDVNGDYKPDNCYFTTMTVQNNNKRNNVRISHGGQDLTSAEWARLAGISLPAFRSRRKYGWPMEKILSTPPHHTAKYKETHK